MAQGNCKCDRHQPQIAEGKKPTPSVRRGATRRWGPPPSATRAGAWTNGAGTRCGSPSRWIAAIARPWATLPRPPAPAWTVLLLRCPALLALGAARGRSVVAEQRPEGSRRDLVLWPAVKDDRLAKPWWSHGNSRGVRSLQADWDRRRRLRAVVGARLSGQLILASGRAAVRDGLAVSVPEPLGRDQVGGRAA